MYVLYILASRPRGALYVGITNDMGRRLQEHRSGRGSTFVQRYGILRLVYAEAFDDVRDAIAQEKRVKRWRRAWKMALVEGANPDWEDITHRVHF